MFSVPSVNAVRYSNTGPFLVPDPILSSAVRGVLVDHARKVRDSCRVTSWHSVNNFSYEAHPTQLIEPLSSISHPHPYSPHRSLSALQFFIPSSVLKTRSPSSGAYRVYLSLLSLYADAVISEDIDVYVDSRYGRNGLAVRAKHRMCAEQTVFGLSGLLAIIPSSSDNSSLISVVEMDAGDSAKQNVVIRTSKQKCVHAKRTRNSRVFRRSYRVQARAWNCVKERHKRCQIVSSCSVRKSSVHKQSLYLLTGPISFVNHSCIHHATAWAGMICNGDVRAAWQKCTMKRDVSMGEELTFYYGSYARDMYMCKHEQHIQPDVPQRVVSVALTPVTPLVMRPRVISAHLWTRVLRQFRARIIDSCRVSSSREIDDSISVRIRVMYCVHLFRKDVATVCWLSLAHIRELCGIYRATLLIYKHRQSLWKKYVFRD